MKMKKIKEQVCQANKRLPEAGLVALTWGNASGLAREEAKIVIKPSGINYSELTAGNMVVLSVEDGEKEEGDMAPSSDSPTHLELYRAFDTIGGVAHTHSPYATSWAQAEMAIPCLGTTHADTFNGRVPICRQFKRPEVEGAYESETGRLIVEHFETHGLDPNHLPGVLVPGHGPFSWGQDAFEAVKNAIIIEEVAKMAYMTVTLNPESSELPEFVHRKHFSRKHGPDAYYGQHD